LDTKLSHAEITYNRIPSYATSHSPFEVRYGLNSLTPLDFILIPKESKLRFKARVRAKEMKLYDQVRAQIKKVNEHYKSKANKNLIHLEFKLEDLVATLEKG